MYHIHVKISDDVTSIQFYLEPEQLIGTLDYFIMEDEDEAYLLYLKTLPNYRRRRYGYQMLYTFAKFLRESGITQINLDDVSDHALNHPPSRTRSGRTWNCDNIYANIGCQAPEGYPSAERVCNVNTVIQRLEEILL